LLNFDAERCNERSALVLMALLDLGTHNVWSEATAPTLRTLEIIGTLRDRYGKNYKPNTRETIRRRTLHQFVEAGLIVINPDEPTRPVNSPKTCYRIEPAALQLARSFGQQAFHAQLKEYLTNRGGLIERYARARRQEMLPVTLPDGTAVELTPGGQNVLLKQMVEQFCPRWTPGGQILYIGDAGKIDPVFEQDALTRLGVRLDQHGKLPDLIVYLPERNWLVLMEAAPSHGPVDEKRYGELRALFGTSSAELVLVSCFPSRAEMRKHLAVIAWETEVWCADAASHLIHFDGERFLGPYDTEA
jgi:hypothetical protein